MKDNMKEIKKDSNNNVKSDSRNNKNNENIKKNINSTIIKKLFSKEVILYVIFGIVTTLVNWVSFYILNSKLNMNENLANIIAIILSVLVAYFTNRTLVFNSQAKLMSDKLKEFAKFMGGRAFTMVLEFGLDALLFLTPIPQMVTKVIMTIVVVILNYFISKFFAFKNVKK